jgi:predicted SnoaL-like aldol condensation-catalyzing enzyme
MTNKEIAISFLKMAGTGNVKPAYEKFIAPNFIHHNQYFKGDRLSLMQAMEASSQQSPNKSIEIKHVYVDGDTVITHSEVIRGAADAARIAVVHIFRFEKNLVVELWDLGQPIDKNSPNENGPF